MARNNTYETPALGEEKKLKLNGNTGRELLVDFSSRSGREFKRKLVHPIWAHHKLPMYRGTAVEEVPFELRILSVTLDFAKAEVHVTYKFQA
jgi:hypothetical protein